MIFCFAEIVLLSLLAEWLFRQCRLPGFLGMLFVGVLFGPNLLNIISLAMMDVGAELRLMALVVILLRAGLKLNRATLSRIGGRALLLSFVPALFEGACVTGLAHWLLGLDIKSAVILGIVLSAVSPAVVVPLMLDYIDRNKGMRSGAPTMVLAASSLENTFVIVVFAALAPMLTGMQIPLWRKMANIPLSVCLGLAVGCLAGLLLCRLFDRFNPRATKRALVVIGLALLLLHLEQIAASALPFAALPAVMAVGFIMLETRENYAHELGAKLGKIWIFAEIILFTMVGPQVDLRTVLAAGATGTVVLAGGLAARAIGINLSLLRSGMNGGERLFITAAYLPKATVQAAIGAVPLLMLAQAGLDTAPGETILAMAVLSIIITAPLGAWATAYAGERYLDNGAETDASEPVNQTCMEILRET